MKFIDLTLPLVCLVTLSAPLQGQTTAAPDKVKAGLAAATQAESNKDFAKANSLCDQLLADPQTTLLQKVAVLEKKAALLKAEKNPGAIVPLFHEALGSQEFQSVPERANLLFALGSAHEANQSFVKAGEAYAQALALKETTRPNRLRALRALAAALVAQSKYDEARKLLARAPEIPDLTPQEQSQILRDVAATYGAQDDVAKARETFLKASQVEGLPPGERNNALTALALFYKNRNDISGFKETVAMLHSLGVKPDYTLLRNAAALAEANTLPDDEENAWREILAMNDLPARLLDKPVTRMIQILATRRNPAELKKFLGSLADRPLSEGQRALVGLLTVALAPNGDWSTLQIPSLDPLSADQQAALLFEAGKVMMLMNNHEGARALARKGRDMFPRETERIYEVPFVKQAPRGVSGWEASPLLKDPKLRESRFEEYNKQAAALLINDVNVARNIADSSGKQAPIAFFMAADAMGWHVYLQYKDEKAEETLAGLLPGGELEMYMEPGKGECYYQFMIGVPEGKPKFVAWSSPNRHFRKLDDFLISEVAPINGGFGIALTFPWELIYDKLPQPDALWPFGVVDFGRNGAFTWGSGQVHELNRFGKVRFPGITESLPAIHRWIVLKAFAQYQKSAKAIRLTWNDPETGDPEFYQTILLPELNRLDELGKLVSTGMTEQDSEKLFQQAVPAWRELDYWVADQRARFLSDKLLAP